jgi:ribonuclease III
VVTHSSWTDRRSDSYERLAFLGDSVLGLAVTAHLYPVLEADRFGAGELSKVRAQVVSGRSCFAVAQRLELPDALVAEAPMGMEHVGRALAAVEHVISDALEAVIGACFLTYGFEPTAEAVIEAFAPEIDAALSSPLDFKSALQERLARDGRTVDYEVMSSTGPPHAPTFRVEAIVNGEGLGRGEGRSKKEAEQKAAREALEALEGRV